MKGARVKAKTHSKWYERIFAFETPYQYLALRFFDILTKMHINVVDVETCPDYIGSSVVKFSCNKSDRLRVEYVYRRCCNLKLLYLTVDDYQNNRLKYLNDHYMIY